MINTETLHMFKTWFDEYTKRYDSSNTDIQRNINLKVLHTNRVCIEIQDIAASLSLTPEQVRMAETTALLHDVGRFQQYARYGTFADSVSENHALLGEQVLKQEKILDCLERPDRELILYTVANHNRAAIPPDASPSFLFSLQLLRDADKLDIWRVVTEHYRNSNNSRNRAVELNLPDTPDISSEVACDIMEGRIVKVGSLKTLNDFKLLQTAWVFDLSFRRTFERLKEREYLAMLRESLPESPLVSDIFDRVDSFVARRLNDSDSKSRQIPVCPGGIFQVPRIV